MKNYTKTIDHKELKEKCGVIGISAKTNLVPYLVRQGMACLQHRGQESAGMSLLNSRGEIVTYKEMGLVPHVLTESVLTKLGNGNVAIGHNRYSTTGSSTLANAQPIDVKKGKYQISIAHNGNIPDLSNIKNAGVINNETSDTLLMADLLISERANFKSWEETFVKILPEFKGAYSLTVLTNDGNLFGIRDPYGIRPLCLGKLPDGWVIASESVALEILGADFVRDIKPGEIIKVLPNGDINSYFFGEPRHFQFCIFEYIYFARPDSFMNGRRVKAGRERSGMFLAERIKKKKIKADLVIPVFDSGYPAAKGVAKTLGLPLVDAITTSHYVGRTFIQPGQENRMRAVNGKHSIVPDEINGKNVIVVDDSAVRFTTLRILSERLRESGAKEVNIALASPPIVNQCDLGIDMRSKNDLPAALYENEPLDVIEKKMAKMIEVEQVIYLSVDDTARAMGGEKGDFYYYPFGGPHPIRGKQIEFPKRKRKISGIAKIAVFISGNGTNLEEIINRIEQKDIDAEIVGVLSNKKEAYGLTRAKEHNLSTEILEYSGKFSEKPARLEYEKKIIEYVKKLMPDIIVLSGWMFVLSSSFLKKMQELEIVVINLHPSLMTETFSEYVATSRGNIPVLRGAHVIKDAFEKKLLVSGITVHQVLPSDKFDVGPIIMKSEVRIKMEDTLLSFEKRMHDAEYQILPIALKRVVHVLKHNVDISQGQFPW